MRETNEGMIELLDASKENNIFSSLIRYKIQGENLKLRFAIDSIDYAHLKAILQFRPFENTGVSPYRYFFALSYTFDSQNPNLIFSDVRVEQLNKHKQYQFPLSRKYFANILWFNSLTEKMQIEKMIEQ